MKTNRATIALAGTVLAACNGFVLDATQFENQFFEPILNDFDERYGFRRRCQFVPWATHPTGYNCSVERGL